MHSCDMVWDSPSTGPNGSMPLGNGDIGINLWMEADGDLVFYISKTDAWSENGRLLKLGKMRMSFNPLPTGGGRSFKQRLDLLNGQVVIDIETESSTLSIRVWVDANHPVIRVEATGTLPFTMTADIETWRNETRHLEGVELKSAYEMQGSGFPLMSQPDIIMDAQGARLAWCHMNTTSIWPVLMRLQGLGHIVEEGSDPLLGRTFGCVAEGEGMGRTTSRTLASTSPQTMHTITIVAHAGLCVTPQAWLDEASFLVDAVLQADRHAAWEAHAQWWRSFWDRSHIQVAGFADAPAVNQAYALQRFVNACGGRGAYPIKFNGSIFNVDNADDGIEFDADYRRWGGPYWFQNTRHIYWPMLASGDYDLMEPFFTMYRDVLHIAMERTRVFFGHSGACFPEVMSFWGTLAGNNYGWDREGKPASHIDNIYIKHHWSGALELAAMGLDYYRHTSDREFLDRTLLPLADAILEWYDQHYGLDGDDKKRFEPAAALETQDAINPLPEIAGLSFVIDGLLGLDTVLTGAGRKTGWLRLKGELPPLPIATSSEGSVLLDAEVLLGEVRNSENPSLYGIFPFRLFGVGKPDLDIGRLTYYQRKVKGNECWRQDSIQAAYLGLASEAAGMLVERVRAKHTESRFSAFWGPNFDWMPDQDHGGVTLMTLQTMLLQADGDEIVLFPAWPKGWDVDFKLHALGGTTVKGVYRDGELRGLSVVPESAMSHIMIMDPQ